MDVTIRRAGIDDLEIVQKLGAELAESEHKNWDKDLDPKWALSEAGAQAYRKMIENSYVAIAFQKDEPVGYLIGSIRRPMDGAARQTISAQLNNIYVKEGLRKQSIGSKLFDDFRKYCKDNGATKLNVTVIASNTDAVKFYQ